MKLAVVTLAAGQGKRMYSAHPKVLHPIGGKPMLAHVIDCARSLQADQQVVVYGHGGAAVQAAFADANDVHWVEQAQQLGTGHAVAQALPVLVDNATVLVLYGDVPLIRPATLQPLLNAAHQDRLAVLTVELDDPSGYGRIVRDGNGAVQRIVEDKDASDHDKQICEINTGIIATPLHRLRAWVDRLDNDNAQGEYYLTDVIEMAVADGVPVDGIIAADEFEVQGVNNRVQQAELERHYQRRQAEQLMLSGTTLLDPDRIDIRGEVRSGQDVVIDVNVIFEGQVILGDRARIGPNCLLRNCYIGADSEILANSVIEQAQVGEHSSIGPFARLRPGTELGNNTKIGNFVETKNAVLGDGSKANHLTYLGDTEIGCSVNIGAGTITCNYDGANKHKTIIEDEVFIGSNTALVAPIRIAQNATVGAGSTLSKDVDENILALTRGAFRQIKGWRRPKKK